jgi:transcriptional regulator with XRE-family HTH domain
MDKLSANKLFKLVRELTGKTQPEVSAGAKITYQSLQQFEKGQASLSKETLKLMVKGLYINPAYIDDTVSYPFKSNGRLIKMFMPDGVVFDNFEPLYLLSKLNNQLRMITLIAPFPELKKFSNIGLPLIYAILLKDDHNNVFLFRRKKEKDIFNLSSDYPSPIVKLTKISQENKSVISIAQKELSKDVFDKIREWDSLSITDIKYLIDEETTFTKLFEPTEAEIVQLELQRNIGVENLSSYELVLINEIRTKDIAIEKVSKMLKEK